MPSSRRLLAIMFTDMVGYTATAQDDEPAALAKLERHNRMLRPVFTKFHGREVKTVGDAFLVAFDSSLDAVRCAVEIQRVLGDYNAELPEATRIRVRIGVHVGDVVLRQGDLLGDAVNIASRVVPLAEPGGVCVTQQVYDLVQAQLPATFAKLPPTPLKNVRTRVTVYKLEPSEPTPGRSAPAVVAPSARQLAVLPLSNISPDPTDGYFADGLTEELISVLSQVHGLSVTARTSVVPYKTAPKPIPQVGSELGVDTVLEGSVRKAGNRIRIALQLVDVSTQRPVWSSRFDRELDDVFGVQTEVAEQTARALKLEFSRSELRRGRYRPVPHPRWGTVTAGAAYDRYLEGLVAATDLGEKGPERAFRLFESATTLDPQLAEAFAAWANLYVVVAGDSLPMREAIPRARELAARALALDPELAEGHAALGNIALQYDNDWELAEAEFDRALALNPSCITAYRFLGALMMALGRWDEAAQLFRRAIELDPGGHYDGALAWVAVESGNFDEGVRLIEEGRGHHAASPEHKVQTGLLYLTVGRREEALRVADTPLSGSSGDAAFDHALLNALLGRPEAARRVVTAVERGEWTTYVSATHLAMLYSALGEKARALDLLEKDYRQGDRVLWLYFRGVFFDAIREDPRFLALLRESRLPIGGLRGGRAPKETPQPRGGAPGP
jgi:adenylate cyclase